jgi:N-acetylmuramoyl-L-alanine amidase
MGDLEAIKLRLVREAIRHNIVGSARSRTRPKVRPRFVLPLGVASAFLVASLLYLSMPSAMVPPVSVTSAHPPALGAARATGPVANPVAESGLFRPLPRRLSRTVLPLSVRRIVLDPGHGGEQPGAYSHSGVAEKEITLDIALRLRRLLQAARFEVLMTRETDMTLSLERRAAFANNSHADLFVSIHVNWLPQREVRPLETYFVGPTDDPATLRLASIENRDSGYSLAAYRRLLDKIYFDTRRDESHALAKSLNAELYRSLSEVNPELKNRGVKTAPFAVLVGTEMPAILVEVSCLSNEADVELLTSADYRDRVAAALLRGIRSYAHGLDDVGRKES